MLVQCAAFHQSTEVLLERITTGTGQFDDLANGGAAMLAGEDLPVKRPDLDNLCKQLKDACTRLQFWHDDSQVVALRCDKIYAETGYWQVAIYEAVPRPAGLQ